MKKLFALLIAVATIFSLTACNNETVPTNENVLNNDSVSDTASESNSQTASSSDNAEWKQFLKDYEAWVDEYIEIVKKYKANPSDMSILNDYTEMVSKTADWSQRASKIETELKDTNAALEYSAELLRIAGKLTEAMK